MLRQLKDQVTSDAWGSLRDTTKEVSPRLTHKGRMGFPVPPVKGRGPRA